MTSKNKESSLTLRIRPDIRDEFKAVAVTRGSTMSGLLHLWISRIIREEKQRDPEGFALALAEVRAQEVMEEIHPGLLRAQPAQTAYKMSTGDMQQVEKLPRRRQQNVKKDVEDIHRQIGELEKKKAGRR